MDNKNTKRLNEKSWRKVLLHPYFLEKLISFMLIVVVFSVLLLNFGEHDAFIYALCLINATVAITGIIHASKNRSNFIIFHLGLLLLLISPALIILFKSGDLRLSIFALPTAYLLQLGLVSHKLKRNPYICYNLLLLVALLMPMMSATTVIDANSLEVQIVLFAIIISTVSFILVMYLWNKTEAFLLVSEKKLIDRIDSVIQEFSQLLLEEDEIDIVLKKVANQIIPALDFEDCVIYLLNEKGDLLIQKAAHGQKLDTDSLEVLDPIEIPLGKGIVGYVAQTGKPLIIGDTSLDARYIQDDAFRYSELAVPIFVNEQVIGVIDSEHIDKNYFNEIHLYLMEIIASLCAAKIIEAQNYSIHKHSLELEIESKKFKEINEAKTRFISNLSHDLKTPLTLILSPVNELKKHNLSTENLNLVELIDLNGKKLKHIIEELLQLNELAFLAQSKKKETVNLGILMNEWISGLNQRCKLFNIDLTYTGDKGIKAETDEKKLTAIVFNIFEHLLKSDSSGDKISIILKEYNGMVRMRISRNGTISSENPEKQKRLQPKLNLIKDLAKKADINIAYQLDRELSFELFLNTIPLSEEKNFTLKEGTSIDSIKNKEKPVILIIEDHDELRNFIQHSLEDQFISISAATAEKGIELAEKLQPDLIVTDLMLPQMTGEEFCLHINSHEDLNHVPIIVLSAKSMTLDRVELYRLGAENYLTKPFDISELKAIINNTIAQRANLRAQYKSDFLETHQINDPFLDKVLNVINENLADPGFNVKRLCTQLETGRNQLQRRIKLALDITPNELIRHTRLVAAQKLLATSGLTVSEIAYKVGFNNLSYFSRAFKAKFQKLPSEVAKKNQTIV